MLQTKIKLSLKIEVYLNFLHNNEKCSESKEPEKNLITKSKHNVTSQ